MSTRLKVFLIITGIVLAITLSSMLISINSARGQILQTLETNMEGLASTANEYVMGEMDLLKADAAAVSQALYGYPSYLMRELLTEQVFAYDNFKAIAVYNSDKKLVARDDMGGAVPPESVVGEYGQKAYAGERIITTTFEDPSSGELVFYVFVPMDDYKDMLARGETPYNPSIIGLTVSGMFFSNRMTPLIEVNPSGRIAILDSNRIIIADADIELVEKRVDFLDRLAASDAANKAVIQGILTSPDKRGTGRFTLQGKNGQSELCVTTFGPIPSPENWVIEVSTPIVNNKKYVGSSYFTIMGQIALSGIIFMALGALAAALASGVIAKPFELLKAAERAKTAFIANMSHDLRTPLNAIIGFSQLSRSSKEIPQGVAENQGKIYESGMTILGVVNDLLDISNIESGKFGVISAEYDLPGFIKDTAESNLRHIGSRPIEFNIVADAKLSAHVIGDPLRVRQIFNNLLSNAIRHTKTGSVEWKIATEKSGDTVWLVSTITDTGGGITPENYEVLFLDYTSQDTQKMRSSQGGTGLGLPLTKKIIEIMGGSITVTTTMGKGSVFTIRLPHQFFNDSVISADMADKLKSINAGGYVRYAAGGMQRIELPGAKVLVVDDSEINLDVARAMIEAYGIQADCVLSSKEAVDLIRKGEPRYKAVFLNRWMPEMDGIEAVRVIRNEINGDYAKNIPIIALVSNAITGNNAFFVKSGFQAVLSKPISILRLDEIIRQWVS